MRRLFDISLLKADSQEPGLGSRKRPITAHKLCCGYISTCDAQGDDLVVDIQSVRAICESYCRELTCPARRDRQKRRVHKLAKRFLKLDVGQGEVQEGHVNEKQREVRAKGLVFEDGIPGVQAGKRAGMSGTRAG